MKKKTLALILALCMTVTGVVCFTAGAAAANGLQEITAYLNSNITFKLDGEEQLLTDATGVRTYPITYNGTTYVPIRAVANLLGVGVDWDQATQTVLMGDPEDGVDLIDTYKAYYASEFVQKQTVDQDPRDISGNTYARWISIGGAPRKPVGSISFNLEGKYDTLTFQYYASADVTLQVIGDNNSILAEIPVQGGQVAQTVTVPLFKTTQLTFQNVEGMGTDKRLYIFDAKLF